RFTVASRGKASQTIISYPRELGFDNSRLLDENEEEPDIVSTKPHGFNKDAFAYLREYHAGESLRHIHWKLSARQDNLIVKHMEANHDCSALIFCDTTFKGNTAEETLEISDTIIETAAAISKEIMFASGGIGDCNTSVVFWQDPSRKSPQVLEISDAQSYGEFFKQIATLPTEPFTGEFSALLNEYSNEIRLERAVYLITARVDENLVAALRDMGLLHRSNVILVYITDDEQPPDDVSRGLFEYLKTQTKIAVLENVRGEEGELI
ncbi:MAG: DUF58 domain-containing protein, partial [Oscillospiraceae bacterium]|nr:DUF58 domain-containing protein [Oscillospiraceae bacterium]